MKYDEALNLLKSNSSLNIVRRMQMIGLDPVYAFAGGDWRNCDFSSLDLSEFDMRNADFRGAIFLDANVKNADFRGSTIDQGLSIARNFDTVIMEHGVKIAINKLRESIVGPISNIYDKENFVEKDIFNNIITNSFISFDFLRNRTFEKFGICYDKIKLTDLIFINMFTYFNSNFKAKDAKQFAIQLIKLFHKHKGYDTKINSIALIEASKYLRYQEYAEHRWPILGKSVKFNDSIPIKFRNLCISDESKIRSAFEICKSKHENIFFRRYDDIVEKGR